MSTSYIPVVILVTVDRRLTKAHTGRYLAMRLATCVQEFGIGDKVSTAISNVFNCAHESIADGLHRRQRIQQRHDGRRAGGPYPIFPWILAPCPVHCSRPQFGCQGMFICCWHRAMVQRRANVLHRPFSRLSARKSPMMPKLKLSLTSWMKMMRYRRMTMMRTIHRMETRWLRRYRLVTNRLLRLLRRRRTWMIVCHPCCRGMLRLRGWPSARCVVVWISYSSLTETLR